MHLTTPKALKRFTNPVVGRIPILVLSGLNRGARWSLAAAGSGYGSGKRESKQMAVLWQLMRPDDVVWDLGAHYGFVTICAARRVKDAGEVFSFEPSKSNYWFLQRHIRWNRLRNVTTLNCAVGDFDGPTTFGGGSTSKQHKLGGGSEVVNVRTISALVNSGECRPASFMKIDVEGAESAILRSSMNVISPSTRMLVAVHSFEVYNDCMSALRAANFTIVESARMKRFRNTRWGGDADLVAFGPAHRDTPRDIAMLERLEF